MRMPTQMDKWIQCAGRRRIVVTPDGKDVLLHIHLGEHKRLATLRLERVDAAALVSEVMTAMRNDHGANGNG